MSGKNRTFGWFLIERVVIRTALVVGILVFGGMTIDRVVLRADLTEDARFTISEASHRMAASLPDQLTIKAYFSEKLPESVAPIYRQVMDILDEYRAASNGKIKVEHYDPDTSTIHKNEADGYGIRPVELAITEATGQRVVGVYGSIVLLFRDRKSEVLNLAQRYPEGYEGLSGLEYDISSRLWQLSNDKPTLGLTGYLSSMPPMNPMNPMGGRPQPMFQGLRRLLGDAFEIQEVDLNQEQLDPEKVPCLLVVRPKEFNDVQKFRLDQYLMKGGRVILFATLGERSMNQMTRSETFRPFKTGLEDWLEFQGIRIPAEFVMQYPTALQMPVRAQIAPGVVQDVAMPNPFIPIISREMEGCIDDSNPAMQSLRGVFFPWAHPVDILEGRKASEVEATVLLRSYDKQSWRWKDVTRIDHQQVLLGLQSGADIPTDFYSSPIVVAMDGKFTSYYADPKEHPVPASLAGGEDKDGEAGTDSPGDGKKDGEEGGKGPEVVRQSVRTQFVVIGNALFVSDLVLGGRQLRDQAKQAAQVAFNLVDWLARSPDLIAMRNKRLNNRDLVDKIGEQLPDLVAELRDGNITREEFRKRINEVKDNQKAERRSWRRRNIMVPGGLVLLVGLLVWIVRVGRRSMAKGVPGLGTPETSSESATDAESTDDSGTEPQA